jgi:hypothetical protein
MELTGTSVDVNDQDFLPQLAGNPATMYDGHYGETTNKVDAFNVFKYAADNTNVEWGVNGYKTDEGRNYLLRTSHSNEHVAATDGNNNSLDLSFSMHIHPNASDSYKPSGSIDRFGTVRGGDLYNVNVTYSEFNAVGKQWPGQYPSYYIYHKQSKSLYHYNYQGKTTLIRPIKTASDFYRGRNF